MRRPLVLASAALIAAASLAFASPATASPSHAQHSAARTPNPGDKNELDALAASGPDDIWAVGSTCKPCSGPGMDLNTFILHSDGLGDWAQVESPSPGQAYLLGADALSPTNAWAVGVRMPTGTSERRGLALHWNGQDWKTTTMPAGLGDFVNLNDVSVAPGVAWAVGGSGDNITLRHTSSGWENIDAPSPGEGDFLQGVDVIAPDDVWAIGYRDRATSGTMNVAMHWDGDHWTTFPVPSPGTSSQLHGVSAVSSTDVWAVGAIHTKSDAFNTLVLHWNGVKWSRVTSPNPGAGSFHDLEGVSARNDHDVWAAGVGNGDLLLTKWNGTKWKKTTAPEIGGSYLTDVEAVGGQDVYAIGYTPTGSTRTTFVLHWNGSDWVEE
jgi:hypothetical protein